MTRSQVDAHRRVHPALAVAVEDVMDGRTSSDDLVAFIEANRGQAPLVYSSAAPEDVAAAHARYGREAVSDRLEGLFAETAKRLVDRGVRRVVVAGGETSGAVAQALGPRRPDDRSGDQPRRSRAGERGARRGPRAEVGELRR